MTQRGNNPQGVFCVAADRHVYLSYQKEWKATLKAIAKSEDIVETVRLHTRTGGLWATTTS